MSTCSVGGPLITVLLFILLALNNLCNFVRVGIRRFPSVSLPTIIIAIALPNTTPSRLRGSVTGGVRGGLADVRNIGRVQAALRAKTTAVIARFILRGSVRRTISSIHSTINRIRNSLPTTTGSPVVAGISATKFPIIACSITTSGVGMRSLS